MRARANTRTHADSRGLTRVKTTTSKYTAQMNECFPPSHYFFSGPRVGIPHSPLFGLGVPPFHVT